MNSYELSRKWFDWCFENPEKINPNHSAIYFFSIEHNNRLGWRTKFGFPSQMAMDAIGIKKHSTYIRYFNDLVDWGFFKLIQKSQNQYSSNIISLVSDTPKTGKALDKAMLNHRDKQGDKQCETIGQSKRSIDKQLTTKKETTKQETTKEKNSVFNFRKSLLSLGIDKNLVDDWLKVRKTKRATNTQTAFNGLKKQLDLCKLDNNAIIEKCIENSWSGFKSEWLNNVTLQKQPKRTL